MLLRRLSPILMIAALLAGCGGGGSVGILIKKAGLCADVPKTPGAAADDMLYDVPDHTPFARGSQLTGAIYLSTACVDKPFGDSCQRYAPLPDSISIKSNGPVDVSPSGQVPLTGNSVDLALQLPGAGKGSVDARADGVGSTSIDVDVRPIDHFGITWVASRTYEKPMDGLLFTKGGAAVLAVRARDRTGAHLCGGQALSLASMNGASFKPDDTYEAPAIEVNSTIAMKAASADRDTLTFTADGATASIPIELVDASAIDSVEAEFSQGLGIKITARAAGREVAGASFKLEILTPGVAAFGLDGTTGPETTMTTTDELASVDRISPDGMGLCIGGCMPVEMVRVRVSVVGSSATTETAFAL